MFPVDNNFQFCVLNLPTQNSQRQILLIEGYQNETKTFLLLAISYFVTLNASETATTKVNQAQEVTVTLLSLKYVQEALENFEEEMFMNGTGIKVLIIV